MCFMTSSHNVFTFYLNHITYDLISVCWWYVLFLFISWPWTHLLQALEAFGDEIAIAFSGAEDVALLEYAHLTGRPFRVFSLDTGRLNAETYQLFDQVEKKYGIRIEYTFPDAQETMDLVREKGMFSFYEDGHQECCRVRKVSPHNSSPDCITKLE